MALFRVDTEKGKIVLLANNSDAAKNAAWGWMNFEFSDEVSVQGEFDFQDIVVNQIDPTDIKVGDRMWNGYSEYAGTLKSADRSDAIANFTLGNAWNAELPARMKQQQTGIPEKADLLDPVTGFLRGLGFDFQQGAGAARDFVQSQARLGQGTQRGQEAVNWFRDNIPFNVDEDAPRTAQQFASNLAGGNLGRGLSNIGLNALSNLDYLSGLGNQFTAGESAMRQFANPYSSSDLNPYLQDTADLLTAAQQGAGLSPLYNRGVGTGQLMRMFTRFAGMNPDLGGESMMDENFLSYAAKELGLDRFFGN